MKPKQILVATLMLLASVSSASAALITSTGTKPSVGNGNSGSPYEIRTAEELRWFVHYENTRHWFPDDHAKLMADIDLSSICGPEIGSWIPLGHEEESGAVGTWKGKLYGNGHTISGLYIECNDLQNSQAGFCGTTQGITITDLTLKGQIINAKGNIGSLIGQVSSGSITISNCVSYVDISTEQYQFYGYLGGLIGYIYDGSGNIMRCSYQGTITGHVRIVGSLIACNYGSVTVKECSAYGGNELGLIGSSNNNNTIINCISDKYILYEYLYDYYQKKWAKLRDNIYVDQEYLLKSDGLTPDIEGGEAMTAADIASGAACYRMNQKMGGQYFTQTIGTDKMPFPGSGHMTVYRVKKYTQCGTDNWEWAYSNTDEDDTTLREHEFDADHACCTRCGEAVNPDYGIKKDAEGYYLAGKADDIKWLWNLVNVTGVTDANIRLTADIDMENASLEPLTLYAGDFDGQGHTLSNINISCSGVARVGLVGKLTGTIRNLILTGTVEGSYASYIGAFAAYVWKGAEISKVRNDCTVKATGTVGGDVYSYIGGVAGYSDGSITYAINNGAVVDASECTGTLTRRIAGVAGYAIPYTEVSHLVNNGVVGAYGAAQNDKGAAVVNVSDASAYSASYYVSGIRNPGMECFYSNTPTTTDTAVSPVEVGSGRLAWLLAGKDYDAEDTETVFFGQTIGTDLVPYPFVNDTHKGVYNTRHYYTCDSYSDYSNSSTDEEPATHTWNDKHYCSVCYAIDPEYVSQDAKTKTYLISTAEQYNIFAAAINAAEYYNKPMKYASASLQEDLDFTTTGITYIYDLYGCIHGNGHKISLNPANYSSNAIGQINEDGMIDYLDVVYPSTDFYVLVSANNGRIVGCNVTRGVPTGKSAGLVIDCTGELPNTKDIQGRYTRCLVKTRDINGPYNYRLYNTTATAGEYATYTQIALSQGGTGELAYTLSHDGGNCEWGQALVSDADPRIYCGQTPASGTYVTRLTSYSVEKPEGQVEYMNAGMGLEAAPGYYKVCEDTESWATHPDHNFIVNHGDGTYTAQTISLTATAQHYLPFGLDADTFCYDEEFDNGDIVSLMFPVDMPLSKINGKVYIFAGYNETAGQLEFVAPEDLSYLPANTPVLVKAYGGSIIVDGAYSESYPLAISAMTGANYVEQDGFSHLAAYSHQNLGEGTTGYVYYKLTGCKSRDAARAANATESTLAGEPASAASPLTVSAFDSYFSIPSETAVNFTTSIPVVLKSEGTTEIGSLAIDGESDGVTYNLLGVPVGPRYRGIAIRNGKKIIIR